MKFARSIGLVLLSICILWQMSLCQGPTPGQNVNMVSGTTWPYGDPFLERQDEPSLAVSTRNPLHLLAGANDYRSVDLNLPEVEPGESTSPSMAVHDGRAHCCPGTHRTPHQKEWHRPCTALRQPQTPSSLREPTGCFTTGVSLSIAALVMA